MRRKKPPDKEQEEEQIMYPPYGQWGPPPPYGYGFPPPPPQPQYIVMPAPPKGRRERRDWMSKLEEQFWDDVQEKIKKKDEKPKPRTFSMLEMTGIVMIGSLFIYPIEAFIIKTLSLFLPH